jgi:hypothetical protein
VEKPSPLRSKISMFALLFAIISIAAVLSAVSYGYFLSVSGQIVETVRDDLRRQTRTG